MPPEWRLKPRQRDSAYEKYDNWQPVESRLHAILAAGRRQAEFHRRTSDCPTPPPPPSRKSPPARCSVKEAPEHVLCFFRSIDGLPQQFDLAARDFLDLDEKAEAVDEAAHGKQDSLKARLAAYVPGNVHTYRARWTGDGITTDHIDKLCEDVYSALERIILDEIEHPHEVVPAEEDVAHIRPDQALDAEGLAHHRFAEERLRFFVGRSEMLANIAGYLTRQRTPQPGDRRGRRHGQVGADGQGHPADPGVASERGDRLPLHRRHPRLFRRAQPAGQPVPRDLPPLRQE